MEYLLLIAADESTPGPGPGEPGFEESMAAWADYTRALMEGGHWIAGASLTPSDTATTVRLADGRVQDGPYAETKEVIGGFYLIRAADLDEAIALVRAIPMPIGAVEVRPLSMRPDETGAPAPVTT